MAAASPAGPTGSALEVVILVLYEIACRFLYLQIGLLIACFMAGRVPAALGFPENRNSFDLPTPLIFLQITLGSLPVPLWAFLQTGPGINDLPFGAINLVFYFSTRRRVPRVFTTCWGPGFIWK